jgi:CelD/BcsL family acetyltransferase involved in cellulose biosynthesis
MTWLLLCVQSTPSDTIGITFEASGQYDANAIDDDHIIRPIVRPAASRLAEERKLQQQNTQAMVSELRSVLQFRTELPKNKEPFLVLKQD